MSRATDMTAPTPAPEYGELLRRLESLRQVGARRGKPFNPDGPEAARAIRDLEAENARLRECLEWIATTNFDSPDKPLTERENNQGISLCAIQQDARAALSGRGRG